MLQGSGNSTGSALSLMRLEPSTSGTGCGAACGNFVAGVESPEIEQGTEQRCNRRVCFASIALQRDGASVHKSQHTNFSARKLAVRLSDLAQQWASEQSVILL